jgi:hypothetical protein
MVMGLEETSAMTRLIWALVAIAALDVSPATAQPSTSGHVSIGAGITVEPAGRIHSIDVDPGLAGTAPVLELAGGVILNGDVAIDGGLSIARSFTGAQRVRTGVIDFADARSSHRDTLTSVAALRRFGIIWGGGGIVFARSVTSRVGPTTRQTGGVEPYADLSESSKVGVLSTVAAHIRVARIIAVVPAFRLYWFSHNPDEQGLSDRFVYRPSLSLNFRF